MTRKPDRLEIRAREMCAAQGLDPDGRIEYEIKDGKPRTRPNWCAFRELAREERNAAGLAAGAVACGSMPQPERFKNAPLTIVGDHQEQTIEQMKNCMMVGSTVAGVICADGHLGYAQPVGGVIAYEGQISVSGVGYDIGCGNMAVRLDTKFRDIRDGLSTLLGDIRRNISFGVGQTNDEKPEHPIFDDEDAWKASGMEDYRQKARAQLGTVGSGNHYVDIFQDEENYVWIGVHFGSRGLGHTTATRALQRSGGKDGIHAAPTVLSVTSGLGQQYLAGMELAGRYAYAGREWVVERVRQMIGGTVTHMVHNHHNYAWLEMHGGVWLWVVRKGATPAMPGQQGFIGGSMGEEAVIIEGIDSQRSRDLLYSTVHGAGRNYGRMAAKRTFTKQQMTEWLHREGVILSGGDVDESPMAYKRLPEVLEHHYGTILVRHTLKPRAVAMAGNDDVDPWKD